jgi:hypothetical protein
MMPTPTDSKRDQPLVKRPYRAPELRVLGDFQKLTAAKGGNMNDGGSKPRTRSTGTNS